MTHLCLLWKYGRCSAVLALLLGTLCTTGCTTPSAPPDIIFEEAPLQVEEEFGLAAQTDVVSSRGKVGVLVIFAKFKDEAPGNDRIPDYGEALFDRDHPGSFTHFYDTMSFGQLQIEGTVVPKRYASNRPASAYRARVSGEFGRYNEFVQEILRKVDRDVDLRAFDNDGPDGEPDSGDDDGRVDYVFVNVLSAPRDFLLKGATGIANLGGFIDDYRSADVSASGNPTRISYQQYHGAILKEGSFAQTAGVMAHEFGHALGLPDLYDKSYDTPAEDSAGIGRWGLMGQGTSGWNGYDGPNPFSPWSLEQLGWIGLNNERLIEVSSDTTGLVISDLYQQGFIYRIPLHTQYIELLTSSVPEYLLLEQRLRTSHYYNRNLPAEGLLAWHVRTFTPSNDHEENKRVNLVCADGLYSDAGHPLGGVADPHEGRDNLDFWAHDVAYRDARGGNLGDATDPFDGDRFTRLDRQSNPATVQWRQYAEANTGFALENIRRQGPHMVVDIKPTHWAGTIRGEVSWGGEIIVDGDLTIAPEGKLFVSKHTRVRFAGTDRLRGGLDPALCEIDIQGDLSIERQKRTSRFNKETKKLEKIVPPPIVFEALVPGDTWYGIRISSTDPGLREPMEERFVLRDTKHGFLTHEDYLASQVATAVTDAPALESVAFELMQNYPNPFDYSTTIPYTLATSGPVRLVIYNSLGQMVRTLVDEHQSEGRQEVVWSGQDGNHQPVASGMYLYRLEVPDQYEANGKMMLLGSGMAQLSIVDSTLQAQGREWSLMAADLTREVATEFGIFAKPSKTQTAFTAGVLWIKLKVLQQFSRDLTGAQIQAQRLSELLSHFDPSPAQRRAVENLPQHLRPGTESTPELAANLNEANQTLAQLVQGHGEEAALFFYMGKWLQTLRIGGLAARSLRVPLSSVVDLSAHAATSRQLDESLRTVAADQALLTSLGRLTDLLEASPRGRGVRDLLDLVESIAEPLTVR